MLSGDGDGNGFDRSRGCTNRIHFMKFSSIDEMLFGECIIYILLRKAFKRCYEVSMSLLYSGGI